MTQSRFSSLAILQCHKEGTDTFDLAAVANEFCQYTIPKNNLSKVFHNGFRLILSLWIPKYNFDKFKLNCCFNLYLILLFKNI